MAHTTPIKRTRGKRQTREGLISGSGLKRVGRFDLGVWEFWRITQSQLRCRGRPNVVDLGAISDKSCQVYLRRSVFP